MIGTPSELTSPDGTLAGHQVQTLWGGTTWASSGAQTPLRFPGQYEDPETGLHYNYQRYYDPVSGSYMTPDPLGLTPAPNSHAYVPNPLVLIDPLGLMGCGSAAEDRARTQAPSAIRLSQSSVNGVTKINESMQASGWVGEPIDVVRMPDGGLTTIDNTRVVAASQAGIDVRVTIHTFDETLPEEFVGRFTTPKGGLPSTWGEAILNRIGGQNSIYRNTYPYGSPFTGWAGD